MQLIDSYQSDQKKTDSWRTFKHVCFILVGEGRSVVCWHVALLMPWPFWFGLGALELTWEVSVINYLIYASLSYAEIKSFAKRKSLFV